MWCNTRFKSSKFCRSWMTLHDVTWGNQLSQKSRIWFKLDVWHINSLLRQASAPTKFLLGEYRPINLNGIAECSGDLHVHAWKLQHPPVCYAGCCQGTKAQLGAQTPHCREQAALHTPPSLPSQFRSSGKTWKLLQKLTWNINTSWF